MKKRELSTWAKIWLVYTVSFDKLV